MCEKSANILHNICYLDNLSSTSLLPNFIDKGLSGVILQVIWFVSRERQVKVLAYQIRQKKTRTSGPRNHDSRKLSDEK